MGLFRLEHMTTGIGARKEARPARARDSGINQPLEGEGSSSEPTGVAVMKKPANLGDSYHIAHLGRLNRTRISAVVVP